MTKDERKKKLKNALHYLGNAQEGINRNLQPVTRVSNNFYEELVELFAFVISEIDFCEKYISSLKQALSIDGLVNRFLAWPLPETVCSDTCVTERNYPFPRVGTNLLTADEARQMLQHVLAVIEEKK
jgi:hypothetical protein